MTKASKLVEQLESQLEQARAALKKKDERLKKCGEHIQELRAQLRKLEAELEHYKQPIDFPKLRASVANVDNSLSDFLDAAIKRAAARGDRA